MSRWSIGWLLVLAATGGGLLRGAVVSAEQKLPNEFCPVQTDKKAVAEFSIVHEGRTIHFCCEDCLEGFKASPQEYLANLPPAPGPSGRPSGHNHPPGWRPPGFDDADSTPSAGPDEASPRHNPIVLALNALAGLRWSAVAALPLLVFLRYREARIAPAARTTVRPLRVGLASAGALLVLVVGWHILTLQFKVQELEGALKTSGAAMTEVRLLADVHYATFLDFGTPPAPARPPLPKRLGGTFYRGNDERDPSLFNGGNYRTATFRVSLRSESRDVEHGDDVGTAPLFIRLDIERGANTPDFFWVAWRMKTMFLTREADATSGARAPIPDRIALTELTPLRRWEALYPIGAAPPEGAGLSGIVYMREQMNGGARFHFGIPYDLVFRDGRLTRDSDIYMGALYRTKKVLPSKLPLHEWFSHEPIPTLPAPRKTDVQSLQGELDSGTGQKP